MLGGMHLLLLFCFVDVVSGTLPWDFEASTAIAATTVDIHGQGDTTIVVGDPSTNTVRLYNQNIQSNADGYTLRQTLSRSLSAYSGFGVDVSLEGNDITGDLLLIGSNSATSNKMHSGAVYLYNGRNSKWSTQQIFTVPVNGIGNNRYGVEWTFFGSTVDLDGKSNQRFVVGCANCSAVNHDRGTIFVYDAKDEKSTKFDQSESLVATSTRLYGLGHTEVAIHGDTIVGIISRDRDWSIGHSDAIAFHRMPTGRWTEMQQLTGGASVTNIAVYDETIVLASATETRFGFTNLGSVFIMYPNTDRYNRRDKDVPAKPQPLQWSVHQILRTSNSFASNLEYGYDMDISGNNMVVMEKSSGNSYFYERETLSGMWSQQRKFVAAATATSSSVAAVEGSHVVVGDGTKFSTFADNRNEDCLIISVEDHFGDGWGNNSLVVESPDGRRELFAPDCDTENPLQFRYCPFQNTDGGKYKFHMPKAREHSFYWEIVWRVFDERLGKWYVGNWDTQMEFIWDVKKGGFFNSRLDHLLPNNITCKACPPKPTNQPTSSPTEPFRSKHPTPTPSFDPSSPSSHLRRLKSPPSSTGGTLHPTISPAPTLRQDTTRLWYYVYMTDDMNMPWFDAEHKGTNYYISDRYGHKLLKVGTMCPFDGTSRQCWNQDLEDGDYIFRVGGALDRFKSTRNWWFCGRTNPGGVQTQFSFRVTNNGEACTITAHYTYTQYCKHVGDYDVVLRFEIGLGFGSDLLPQHSYLGTDDRDIIKSAFVQTFSALNVHSVTVVDVDNELLTVDVGFQPKRDVFHSEEVFESVVNQLKDDVVSTFVSRHDYFSHFFASNPRLTSPMHYVQTSWMISVGFSDISGLDSSEEKTEWGPSAPSDNDDPGDVISIGEGSDGRVPSSSTHDTRLDNSRRYNYLLVVTAVCVVLGVVLLSALYLRRKYELGTVAYDTLPMDASCNDSSASSTHIIHSNKKEKTRTGGTSKTRKTNVADGSAVKGVHQQSKPTRKTVSSSRAASTRSSTSSSSSSSSSDKSGSEAVSKGSSRRLKSGSHHYFEASPVQDLMSSDSDDAEMGYDSSSSAATR